MADESRRPYGEMLDAAEARQRQSLSGEDPQEARARAAAKRVQEAFGAEFMRELERGDRLVRRVLRRDRVLRYALMAENDTPGSAGI